jgi:hypothetical protein
MASHQGTSITSRTAPVTGNTIAILVTSTLTLQTAIPIATMLPPTAHSTVHLLET